MSSILPGARTMLNYHPLLVHFPIALWVGALLFEIIAVARGSGTRQGSAGSETRQESSIGDDWHRTAARLLYLGTLFALAAAWTGLLAEEAVPETGPAHDVMELHQMLMLVTTSAAVGLCMFAFFLRRRFTPGLRKLFLAGLVALVALLTVGSDRGAQLVYQYATSVRLPAPPK